MSVLFGTDEWAKTLQEALNESAAYKAAAAKWEGDFYFIIEKGDKIPDEIFMYLDLWHGEAREAYLAADPSAKNTAFELRAPLEIWQGVLNKKIDPIQGIMTRKLKLKGKMMKIMKSPKAATALVECAASVDTEWPS